LFRKTRDWSIPDIPPKVIIKQEIETVIGVVPIKDSILEPFVNSISPTDSANPSFPLEIGAKIEEKSKEIGYKILKSIKIWDITKNTLTKPPTIKQEIIEEPSREGRNRRDRGSKGSKGSDTGAKEGMVRLFINVGRNQRVQAKDIVGAIAGEVGIPGKLVGTIDIYDKYTFVEVPKQNAKKVLEKMKNIKIKGNKINIERANRRKK